jgi:tetratricopeptide (TPR) repeat protein
MVIVAPLLAVFLTTNQVPQRPPQKTFEMIAKRADVERAGDRVNDAIELYTEGVRLRPSWSEGWWSLGSLLYDQDRFPEAQAAFKRFAAIAPRPGPAYAFLGLCEYETQDYDRALQHFRQWVRAGWAGTPELLDVAVFHFALLLTREGRFLEALYLLATEEGKMGSSPALVEAMGLASLRMKSLPQDYPPQRREMVWLAGEAALRASSYPQDFARVDEYARRLLSRYDLEPNVHYFRGTLYGFEHKNSEAAVEFRRELEISTEHVPAMVEIARIDVSNNQLVEAMSLAKRAAEIEPKNPEARHVLGQVLFATRQFRESAEELEAAKQLAPDSAPIRIHLARVYNALGRKEEAEKEVAAVRLLKDKEQVLAPPQEKVAPQRVPERPR